MSGIEGKQNNSQMSKRKIEEDQMAQELMNMEMYEEGMNFEQMKQILQVINESKDMAGIEPDNRSSQETNQYKENVTAAETLPKNNSQREFIEETNTLPKPTFSYRQHAGRSSPLTLGHKSTVEIAPAEGMSVSSPEMFEDEESNRRFSGEGESLFDKLIKDNEATEKEDTVDSKSQQGKNPWQTASDSSQNSQNSLNIETTNSGLEANAKSKKNQRLERWKLDPTNSIVDENDVPLKEKTRPVLKERVPYSFCHDRRSLDSNIGDKVLTVLTHALEEVADIWRRNHRPVSSEFQWGSPIKVGTNKRILDKNPVIEEANSPERCDILRTQPDSVQRRIMERNCKRKAAEHIRDLVNDGQVNSDEDEDNIFDTVKKQKKNDKLWEPSSRSSFGSSSEKSLTRQDKMFNNLQNSNKKLEQTPVIDDSDSDDFDFDNLRSVRKKNKNIERETSSTPPPSEEYPRRIVPPNPNKPRTARGPAPKNNGEKGKRKSPVRKISQAVLERNKNSKLSLARGKNRNPLAKRANREVVTLNNEEISKELEIDEVEEAVTDVEIKPLPVRGLANKLQHGAALLLGVKKNEEKLSRSKIQEKLDAEKEEKLRKQELVRARINKEKEEREEREAKELAVKFKEETWRRNEPVRERERRRRQADEKKQSEEAEIGLLLMDDVEEDDVNTMIEKIDARKRAMEERVQCPICGLEFSNEEIQGHAADCNQFDIVDDPEASRSPAQNDELTITNEDEIFDCQICSRFSTTNGNVFELHVKDCVSRQRDNPRSQNLLDSPAIEVVEVPTSPIKCFVPISKLRESAIDYGEQFPEQKFKANTNTERMKRRR